MQGQRRRSPVVFCSVAAACVAAVVGVLLTQCACRAAPAAPAPTPSRRASPSLAVARKVPPVVVASSSLPPAGIPPPGALPRVPPGVSLSIPAVGTHTLRVLSPTVLELTLVQTAPRETPTRDWRFGAAHLPAPSQFRVTVNGREAGVQALGFKQRARYAPDRTYDLRIASTLLLRLAKDIPAGARVEVSSPSLLKKTRVAASAEPLRPSPAIHVNQEGYATAWPKIAMVGAYLGTLGEMRVTTERFDVIDDDGRSVFSGTLQPRPDGEFGLTVQPYRQVLAADFSALRTPGRYRLKVTGLGTSCPFLIDDAVAASFARAYALGIYHQRCGAANDLPFTRFRHGPCHLPRAQVPTTAFKQTNRVLADATSGGDRWQTARRLASVAASLYPFKRTGPLDVRGGHHDAGDYSKYLINSAQMIHHLVFAADHFPGVARLDNLGVPESGDGKSDLLQLAKWEGDFLCRAQDSDGGFYFLIYPRDHKYEWNVLPDRGYPQVVFPKNTSATAAATAALAQMASSPAFRTQFPQEAARCLKHAKAGFAFLERAWAKHGRRGAYQRVTHYGAEFGDQDEIAWAQAEMYLATGDPRYQKMLMASFNPDDPSTLRWTWWRLFESYGCAIRDLAFAPRSGRKPAVDPALLEACRRQVLMAGDAAGQWAADSAYATSYPAADKRYGNAAWYFATDRAFDAAVAWQLDPTPTLFATVIGNLNFDHGTNPNNVTFVTGLGWTRQHEIVSQYAKNDRRVLPPSGIPVGSLGAGEPYLGTYGISLRAMSRPLDDDRRNPYPIYDRWSDTWDVRRECVTALQARCLATASLLMARSPLAGQAWKAAPMSIEGLGTVSAGRPVTVRLRCGGMDPTRAVRVVWERGGAEPVFGGTSLTFTPGAGSSWLEAEVQWKDGRRAFASVDFTAR